MSTQPRVKDDPTSSASNSQERNTLLSTSISLATAKKTQCQTFLTFACYIRDQIQYHQHRQNTSPHQPPNSEDKDDISALKLQWWKLCEGTLLQGGGGEVLKAEFVSDAETELGRVSSFDKDGDAVRVREVWREVLELRRDCVVVKGEVDGLVGVGG